jgi:hypothetical protein
VVLNILFLSLLAQGLSLIIINDSTCYLLKDKKERKKPKEKERYLLH